MRKIKVLRAVTKKAMLVQVTRKTTMKVMAATVTTWMKVKVKARTTISMSLCLLQLDQAQPI